LAVLNGDDPRNVAIPLSFLPEGRFNAMLVGDRAGEPTAMEVKEAQHKRADSLSLNLEPGGGFIARFTPAAR
jgi:alpha-glucosidase